MLPIPIRMEIKGDQVDYDFTGTHPAIRSLFNASFGGTFAGIVSGMKTFFPDIPLNSGFYRAITVSAPDNTLVSARWPFAVTGFLHPMEKIVNSIFELWSRLMPERAIACAFNTEYLLMGGHDTRLPDKPVLHALRLARRGVGADATARTGSGRHLPHSAWGSCASR